MRGSSIDAGASGAIGQLSGEICRLFDHHDWLWEAVAEGARPHPPPIVADRAAGSAASDGRRRTGGVGVSRLVPEHCRRATAPNTPAWPAWTAEDTIVSRARQPTRRKRAQSNLYDWIVQFNTASLAGISSVAADDQPVGRRGHRLPGHARLGPGRAGAGAKFRRVAGLRRELAWPATPTWPASSRTPSASSTWCPTIRRSAKLWGMTKIDAPDAWNISTGSQSVVVAVIDTGVDYTDSDLAANIWTNPGESTATATTRRLHRRRARLRFRQQRRRPDGRQRPRHARRRHDRRRGEQQPRRGRRGLVGLDHALEVSRTARGRATSPTPFGPSITPRWSAPATA